MTILIVVIHVIVCLFLIAVVLLQSGKSGDLAAAFGGQGSQTAFGPRGAARFFPGPPPGPPSFSCSRRSRFRSSLRDAPGQRPCFRE